MRITAFVADDQALGSAGVRIRYDRLRPALSALGHQLDVVVATAAITDEQLKTDCAIITKVYDGRAAALARRLRVQGARVGVDIFDDYFSQRDDARFTQLRGWMTQLAPHLDFALCATGPMRDRLARLLPGLPAHVINDPHEPLDPKAIAASVAEAAARARRDRVIPIAWFGIGDNGHFQVGLDDVAAFGGHLSAFARHGWSARLRVLTNPRAMTVARLEGLARLPIPYEVEEWTAPRQEALLRDALVSFLPVNAQAFSTVKSMNRGVSALLGGTQVLSVGYPLYAPLGPMIYHDAGAILDDLDHDRLRLRRATLPVLSELLSRAGDPDFEAGALAAFLAARTAQAGTAPHGPLVVVHGCQSTGITHKAVGRLGALSIAHPFLPAPRFNPDLALSSVGADLVADLSRRGRDRLAHDLRDLVVPAGESRFRLVLPVQALGLQPGQAPSPGARTGMMAQLASYDAGLVLLRAAIRHLFGADELVISERAAPFGAVMRPQAAEG